MKFNTPKFKDVTAVTSVTDIGTDDANKILSNDGSSPIWGTPTPLESTQITNVFAGSVFTYQIPNWIVSTVADIDTFPSGTTINLITGLLSIPNAIADGVARTYTLTANNITAGLKLYPKTYKLTFTFPVPIGQYQYDGAYGNASNTCCAASWVAPSGVNSVNVLVMGAGGGGMYAWANCGGAGGGMSWANNIPVVPGTSYCIIAGNGGCWDGGKGGLSCFPNMVGCGGGCGCCSGTFILNPTALGTSCGGYGMVAWPSAAGGGGGGAGYTNGCCNAVTPGHTGIGGGGGGATSNHSSSHGSGGGGGTGIYGQGGSGACGNAGYSHQTGSGGQGGSGGTCGRPGEPWQTGSNGGGCGGTYGGGGGGGGTSSGGGWGGPGAVRIIWGPNRSWPVTNTGNL